MIDYAYLDAELFVLFKTEETNAILTHFLLDRYLPYTKMNYFSNDYNAYSLFDELKEKILEEDAEKYKAEIEELLNDKNEEEIFLRCNAFKREIPQLYNNTCSISGMRITSTLDISMIDACHIKRWSESHDDTRTNGIALCPNLHRAFDRGLISIDEQYRVKISNAFNELDSDYSIKQFEGKRIVLPAEIKNYPLMTNLEWHRLNVFRNGHK